MVIFATSNSTERLSKPLLSRFTVLEIPQYTYPEFEGILTRLVNKLPQNTVNTDSIVSLESGEQGYKLCTEDSKIMQSLRYRGRYYQTNIDTSEISQNWTRVQSITLDASQP
jgi:hypothetical protein